MEVLLGHESLSSAQIAAMRADLDRLPPTLAMADKVDVFERSRSLEYASDIVRNETYRFINDVGGEAKDSIINGFLRKGVHWNQTLRAVNSWYDNYVDAWRKPTRAERIDATKKSRDEQGKTGTRFRSWASPILPAIAALSKDAPGYVYDPVPLALVHDSEIEDTLDDLTMQFELTKLAFALAAYHADNGAFPEKLADLVPKYVADVPKDIFNDADLHYQLEGDGYLLYSVGLNGIDDGGKTNCDDITVHIAAVKSKTTVPEKESIAPTD
jgi:hypothetical protein